MVSAPPAACEPPCLRPHSAWMRICPDAAGHATVAARLFIGSKIRRYGNPDFSFNVRLVGSELVTNANDAIWRDLTPGQPARFIRLDVQCEPRWVRLSVTDPAPELPVRCDVTELDEHGRGLALVDEFTAMWWTQPHPHGGKTVHAVLPTPGTVLNAADIGHIARNL